MYEELKKKYQKIVGWGTGGSYEKYGRKNEQYLSYLLDGNSEKWNQKIGMLDIKEPDYLKQEKADEVLVVVYSEALDPIKKSILSKGKFDIIDGGVLSNDNTKARNIDVLYKKELDKIDISEKWVCVIDSNMSATKYNGEVKFINEQYEDLRAIGYNVLHIAPVGYYMGVEQHIEKLAVYWNQEYFGVFSKAEIDFLIHECEYTIIHSPYYAVDLIVQIYLDMKKLKQSLFYLHDYLCACNKGALPIKGKSCFEELSIGCVHCDYKEQRDFLQMKWKRLLYDKRNLFIAPSDIVKVNIGKVYPEIACKVVPHYVYQKKIVKEKKVNDKIRIAFLGRAQESKGWNDFKYLAEQCKDKFDFYCLGKCDEIVDDITFVNVCVETCDEGLCMEDALKEYKIDIAFLGSTVCETYSFTYIEAYTQGVYVLTTKNSGNVADVVRKNGNGYVAEDIDNMVSFLKQDITVIRSQLLENEMIIENVAFNQEYRNYLLLDEKEL